MLHDIDQCDGTYLYIECDTFQDVNENRNFNNISVGRLRRYHSTIYFSIV